MLKLAVIGAGAWGSALAYVALKASLKTSIWSKNLGIIEEINKSNRNTKYMGQAELTGIIASTDLEKTLEGADIVVNALPSKAMKEIFTECKPYIKNQTILINASKGMDPKSHQFPFEMFKEIFSENLHYFTISGPSFAEGLLQGNPTVVHLAGINAHIAKKIRDVIKEKQHVYLVVSDDVIGVEWGGIYKNVVAMAVGFSRGLGYEENTRALIFSAGFNEMVRAGIKMGANPMTFQGPSGVGDLMLSASSMKSRNFSFGYYLASEKNADNVFKKLSGVAEGYYTLQSISYLKSKYNLELPLATMLQDIIFHKADHQKAFSDFLKVYST